jgi:hypothetical protein
MDVERTRVENDERPFLRRYLSYVCMYNFIVHSEKRNKKEVYL